MCVVRCWLSASFVSQNATSHALQGAYNNKIGKLWSRGLVPQRTM